MTATIAGGKLTIVLDLPASARPSSTGKTMLIATESSVTPLIVNGKNVKIAVNATIPADGK